MFDKEPLTRDRLISDQLSDLEIQGLSTQVLSPDEAEKVLICYYKCKGVVMRK